MPTTLPLLRAATLLVTLAVPCAAWSQTSPWGLPPAPPAHGVPVLHARRVSAPPALDDEAPRMADAPTAPPREVSPLSGGRVVTQLGVGTLAALGGGFLGALGGIPFALGGSEEGFFATMYLGAALATAGTVTGIGRGFDGDGEFSATLLGASVGAFAGWGLQFWAFARSDDPSYTATMLLTGLLTVTGSVVGYTISASSPEDIVEARRRRDRAHLAPTFQPLREGALLGVSGAF